MTLLDYFSALWNLPELSRKVDKTMADLTQLETKVDSLLGKIDEAADTLRAIKALVIELRENAPPDQQARIDAITAKIDTGLEKLTAAEDDADDVLTTGEEPIPTPES